MTPKITRVIPLYPKTNFVQWTVDDPTNVLSSFSILRSGSPTGPFEDVASGLSLDTFYYNDATPGPHGLSTKIWYQVKAVPTSGAINGVTSDPAAASIRKYGTREKIYRKARYDLSVNLSKLSGVRITVLKRKRFGQRCPICYNETTRDVVISYCETCYGTSYDGGYHAAYATWGKVDPASLQEGFDRTGSTEVSVHGITMADYPLVESDDVIVENDTNRRFVVKRKMSTETSGATVHQDLQVSELSRSAIEYRINIDFNK